MVTTPEGYVGKIVEFDSPYQARVVFTPHLGRAPLSSVDTWYSTEDLILGYEEN